MKLYDNRTNTTITTDTVTAYKLFRDNYRKYNGGNDCLRAVLDAKKEGYTGIRVFVYELNF